MNTQLSFNSTDWVSHFDKISHWWSERGLPVPSRKFLPKIGYIVWCDGVPQCAGFLFKTDANIAIINHVISNPAITGIGKHNRSQSIDALLGLLMTKAKLDGFKLITASSNVARLNTRYESLGFIKSDENETHFGRSLE